MPPNGNARFQRLHTFLGDLYFPSHGGVPNGRGGQVQTHGRASLSAIGDIKAAFAKAAKYIHDKKGFSAEDLEQPEVQGVIETTFKTILNAVETGIKYEVSPSTMNALRKNTFVFSGMKTYTSLREVGSLDFTDKAGKPVSWHEFKKQADELNVKYNEHYLNTEYQFAAMSAENVSKWEQLDEDSILQYRTALDGKARDSHAEMEGITLPASDKFWDENYPPNGWNCRCVAVEVRAGKYPMSDSADAFDKGRKSSTQIGKDGENKAALFRFNPGKQKKIFPDGHPYTSGNCGELKATWTRLAAKIGTKAASAHLAKEGDKCKAKKVVEEQANEDAKKNEKTIRDRYLELLEQNKGRNVTKSFGGQSITTKFNNKKGLDHFVNDVMIKTNRISEKELSKIHEFLKESKPLPRVDLYKDRNDGIEKFYYLHDEKRRVIYQIAERPEKRKNGLVNIHRFLYGVVND